MEISILDSLGYGGGCGDPQRSEVVPSHMAVFVIPAQPCTTLSLSMCRLPLVLARPHVQNFGPSEGAITRRKRWFTAKVILLGRIVGLDIRSCLSLQNTGHHLDLMR